MQQPLKIGVLGLGTVGAGTLRVLSDNAASIQQRAGRPLEVVAAAVRNPAQPRDCQLAGLRLETDPLAVARADDVDVVVELIGGTDRARDAVLAALAAGKPVVTANKALIAEHGPEIFAAARETGQPLAFEAAVAGGIPIIKAVREGLAGNAITEINGLINGTTNFILTKMQAEGADFGPVLEEAQQLGYAEADPTFDVQGIDAAHKLAILAMLGFDLPLDLQRIRTRGVDQVESADLDAAQDLGYRIKHLAVARRSSAGVEMYVEPTLLPEGSYLAKVDGVMNGVVIAGSAVGSAGFYGPGAGALATASAVVADLIDVARGRVLPGPGPGEALPYVDPDTVISQHYLRLKVRDEPGVLQTITGLLAQAQVSVESLIQKELDGQSAQLVLLTHEVSLGTIQAVLDQLTHLDCVQGEPVHFRVSNRND